MEILRLGGRGGGLSGAMHLGSGVGLNVYGQQTYMQRVLSVAPANLIRAYTLGEPVGTSGAGSVIDYSGLAGNATPNHVTFGATGIGDGLTAAQLADVSLANINPYSAAFNTAFNGNEWGFSAWFKVADVATWADTVTPAHYLLYFGVDANNSITIYRITDKQLYFYVTMGGTSKGLNYTTDLLVKDTGNWFHVYMSVSKIGNRLNVAINGQFIYASPVAGLGTWSSGALISNQTVIGARSTSLRSWPGCIARPAIWSGVGSEFSQAQLDKVAWVNSPPAGGVALMFDDGWVETYTKGFSYMAPRNVRATSYTISDAIDGVGRCTVAQLQTMDAAGWDIGNHTKTHQHLSALSLAEQETELSTCAAALDALGLTRASRHVAYPYGSAADYNADTLTAMASTGMVGGRTTIYTNPRPSIDLRSSKIYELECLNVSNTTSLATVQAAATNAVASHRIQPLLFHLIGGATDMTEANFQTLIDWLVAQNIPCYTITQVAAMIRPTW